MLLLDQLMLDNTAKRPGSSRQIELRAHMALHRSSHPQLWRIQCQLGDGALQLQGRVPTYFLKQMAQTLLMREFGREIPIENRLEVLPPRVEARFNDVRDTG